MIDDNEADSEALGGLDAAVRAALTPAAVRTATRARLLARAHADVQARGVASSVSIDSRRGIPSRLLFAGTVLALAASLVLLVRAESARTRDRAEFATMAALQASRLDSLETVVAVRDRLISSLAGADVKLVRLASAQQASPRALMFWDQAANRWTFIANSLPRPGTGRTYQLWLVTGAAKISAGTFSVTAAGDAVVQATYALDRNALQAVAVTEEPAGGVPAPTGPIVLVGAVGTQ